MPRGHYDRDATGGKFCLICGQPFEGEGAYCRQVKCRVLGERQKRAEVPNPPQKMEPLWRPHHIINRHD